MAKQTKSSKSKSSNRGNKPSNTSGRPKPMSPKAGVTLRRSRYGNGGELCW